MHCAWPLDFQSISECAVWLYNCVHTGMNRTALFWRYLAALFVIFSSTSNVHGAEASLGPRDSAQGLAFARYIAALNGRDPFEQAGPVAVRIEASFPALYKDALVLAIRVPGENGRPMYHVVDVAGDGAVLSEVVGRYFKLQAQLANLPPSSLAVTPGNYKFRPAGEVNTGGTPAYIYRIAPKNRRPGLLTGRIWTDSETGAEVLLAGHLKKLCSIGEPADLVRDTRLRNGLPYVRVTHLTFAVPNLGRAELVVTEYVIRPESGAQPAAKNLRAFVQ
jgi:hypothetical protein